MLKRRALPRFFILNRSGGVEFASPNLVDADLIARSKQLLVSLTDDAEPPEPVFERYGEGMMLRVFTLSGDLDGYVAVFIEDAGPDALTLASERFALTPREREVLRYILKGFSNARIAESLFISEGTVGDHVKKVLRKTRTNSRSELVVRVLDRDVDPAT